MNNYEIENNCTLYICTDHYEIPSLVEIQRKLESSNVEKKIEGMENIIFNIIQGENYGNLLMCVIRFIVPHKDHRLKKLSHIFFEIVDKCNNDGHLKEEMILVCNALRNDIISSNEYVRGSTLKLLGKIKHLKILDPLFEAITKNLTYRHSYVRKNAINCVHTIIKEFGLEVLPNAVTEVEKLLYTETDISTKCSALSMLTDIDPMITLKYILSLGDKLFESADVIQLEIIHLFKKLYIPHIFDDLTLLKNDDVDENDEFVEEKDENEESDEEEDDDDDDDEEEEEEEEEEGEEEKEDGDDEGSISKTGKNINRKNKNMYNYNVRRGNEYFFNGSNEMYDDAQTKQKKLNENDYNQYKNTIVKILLNMLNKNVSNSVLYEGACCLLYISNSALSIKTASECFIKLLIRQHDNNIKLIVIDKLYYIMCKWKHVLEGFTMDLLRALTFPSKDIKVKILNLILHILTNRNVSSVLNVLKKELMKLNEMSSYTKGLTTGAIQTGTNNIQHLKSDSNILNNSLSTSTVLTPGTTATTNVTTNHQEVNNYKKILIKTIQHIGNMYPTECVNIIDLLLICANDEDKKISYESAICVRQLVNIDTLQNIILDKLTNVLFNIKQSSILRIFFWILGQYINDENKIFNFLNIFYEHFSFFLNNSIEVESCLLSKIKNSKGDKEKANFNLINSNIKTKTVILKDGTYATEAVLQTDTNKDNLTSDDVSKYNGDLFSYTIMYENDDVLYCVIAVSLTKFYLKLLSINESLELKENVVSYNDSFYEYSNNKDQSKTNNLLNEKTNNPNWIKKFNEFRNKGIHILASILKYMVQKNDKFETNTFENDSNVIRINQCLKIFLKITYNKIIDEQTKKLMKSFLNGNYYFQRFLDKEEEKYCCLYGANYRHMRRRKLLSRSDTYEENENTAIQKEMELNENQDNINNQLNWNNMGMYGSSSTLNEQNKTNVDGDIFFRMLKEKKNILNIFDEESLPVNENLETLKLKHVLNNDILFEENEFKYPTFKHNYSLFLSKLYNTQRLTGTDDDIFIEAFPFISNVNLVIEFYIYNKSNIYLQNIYINLSTRGNLKPIDKMPIFNLSPNEKKKFKISVKVHTTETGIIFGYIFYEKKNDSNKNYIVLNELHINMSDYINTSFISSHLFRIMWSEFEWENKININTSIKDAFELLKLVIKNTNMTIVEKFMPLDYFELETKNKPELTNINPIDTYISYISTLDDIKSLTNSSAFFAVNLFSRSIFGEDSLANLSIQKNPDGKLTGSIRVRSRTQGIALSLGDKITLVQAGVNIEV